MRIVTWNIAHRNEEAAWRYLLEDLRPDVALVQETAPPERIREIPNVAWEAIAGKSTKYGNAATYAWGSAIYSRAGFIQPKPAFLNAHRGWVIARRVRVARWSVLAVSIHCEIDRHGYSIPTGHRILSDLTPLLVPRRTPVILGGDLNADRLWDQVYGTRTHGLLIDRIEAFGLYHCNRRIPAKSRRTFRRGNHPWQDDHVFVRERLKERIKASVIENATVRSLSDHNPVVVEVST